MDTPHVIPDHLKDAGIKPAASLVSFDRDEALTALSIAQLIVELFEAHPLPPKWRAGACVQISTSPERYIAEHPPSAILSIARSERPTAQVFDVRFKYGGGATFMFFDNAYSCQAHGGVPGVPLVTPAPAELHAVRAER